MVFSPDDLPPKACPLPFSNLLNNRPINHITVTDICKDCGINRQTFYYHFQDIYDLCFWVTERNLRAYIEECNIDKADACGSIKVLFEYFMQHKQQVRHAYDALNRVQYETLLKERAKPMIMQRLLEYDEAARVSEENLDFIASFYTLSLSGFL